MNQQEKETFFELTAKAAIPSEETLYLTSWIKGYLGIDKVSDDYEEFRQKCLDAAMKRTYERVNSIDTKIVTKN